jgi:DNA replication and repair protein RecF
MGFELIQFYNFRNLIDGELSFNSRDVFLVGENGQGKTNLIEALYLLCVASSFRENHDAPLFRIPDIELGLSGSTIDEESVRRSISLRIPPRAKKDIRVDGKQIVDRKEMLGRILCICFIPQDLEIVNGPPDHRRRFFDQTLVLSDLPVLDTIRSYRRMIRARNIALKTNQLDLLDIYDRQIVPLGLEITSRRISIVKEFNSVFCPLFHDIAGVEGRVELRYCPSWSDIADSDEALCKLGSFRARDIAFGSTTLGPHRDSLQFSWDDKDFSAFASTGQIRLCALILRIAQARYLAERTGRKPILLLDDVLLELDPGKRRALISRFPEYEQAFFTFLSDENFLPYQKPGTLVLNVEKGVFQVR